MIGANFAVDGYRENSETMRKLQDIPLNPLSVRPDETIERVLALMEQNGETAATVMEGGSPIGVLTYEAALLSDPTGTVRDSMRGVQAVVDANESVRTAAKAILEHKMDHALVFDGARFRGLVSSLSLLDELQHSWDPKTGLPWSDRLREWACHKLANDQEVSILFFDIDDFGKYNKIHGHVVGDNVIKAMSRKLERAINPSRDLLVRFAGDEFAIGTLRNRVEAERLLESMKPLLLEVNGLDDVKFSAGISGGKRSQSPARTFEDQSIHVDSTYENLIQLASRACTANKAKKKNQKSVDIAIGAILSVERVQVSQTGVKVVLRGAGREVAAEVRGKQIDPLSAVATATARAYEDLFEGRKVQVEDVVIHRNQDGGKAVSVIGHLETEESSLSISGTHDHVDDLPTSVARALCAGLLAVS